MSPKLEVYPLSYWCLKCVSGLLKDCLLKNSLPVAEDDEQVTSVLGEYLCQTTGDVLQDLLRDILNSEALDASTRFACLRLLLREDVRRLDTGSFPHSYYEPILRTIRCQAAGLQHLNLKGIWLRDYPEMLIETLQQLKSLKVLSIPHMASDPVIKFLLVSSPPSLNVLDISGESIFSRKTLKSFRSVSLRVLSIGMWGKKNVTDDFYADGNEDEEADVVASLLRNCPNLIVLKTYSFTGRALGRMAREVEGDFRSKLKYLHDTRTSLESLEAIANLCPQLESINLNEPGVGVLNNLGRLRGLNSLKISAASAEELRSYLLTSAASISSSSTLQSLKLGTLKEGGCDVSQICLAIPDLRRLEFYKCKLVCLQPDNYFVALQSLEILYCDVSDSMVMYFLHNAPFLRRLLVGDVLRMTDGDMFRLCADCELLALEEVWFSTARGLTVTSVQLLMGHCPNLKVLGQLSGWDVSANDMDYLRTLILSSNIDLTLLPLETF